MSIANRSFLSQGIIHTELYDPSKRPRMRYPSMGRYLVDAATQLRTKFIGTQTLNVCQTSYGG